MNNAKHWSDKAIADLKLVAEKCDTDISDTRVMYDYIDRTWGDKMGLIVEGGKNVERVAKYLDKWCARYVKTAKTGYEQQNSYTGLQLTFVHTDAFGRTFRTSSGESKDSVICRKQFVIPMFYYPCAD